MIEIHLSELMGRKKLKISELSRMTGLAPNTIGKLYHGKNRQIDLEVLDRVSTALGVEVGDILVKVPDTEASKPLAAASASEGT